MQFYAMYSAVFSGVLAPLSRTIFAPTFSANWMLASSELPLRLGQFGCNA